jgi:single-strand DNA-binding protein
LENGRKMALLNIATGERKKNADGTYAKTTNWHKLVIWGRQAELVENYVGKGQRLFVEGKLVKRSWADKNGRKHNTTEIQVNKLFFINRKSEQQAITDDLPF